MVNVKVEFEPTPIRHLAIQCPKCKNWFKNGDIADVWIYNEPELYYTEFHCPKCENTFTIDRGDSNVEEAEFPEFYKNCLQRKETWE
jgi:phage FluMu protein Com